MPKAFTLYSVFILLLSVSKLSFSTILIVDEQAQVSLQPYLSWYFDPSGEADINTLIDADNRFIASPEKIHFQRTTGAHWLRFDIQPAANTAQKNWLLELAYTQLDRIDLYSRTAAGPLQHQQLGDSLPVSQQKIFSAYPVFPLTLQNGQSTRVYLRVQSSTSINIPLTLWQKESFYKHKQQNLLIGGIVYGVFIGLIFYNLFLYPTVRSPAYLWFALYLSSFAMFQFSLEGYARLYFWPQWPALADRAVSLSLWLCMASGLRFTQYIAYSRHYSPRLDRLFSTLVIFSFFIAAIIAIAGPAPTFILLAPFGIVVALLIPWPLLIATRAGYKPARFALLAFLPVLPGALLIAARSMAIIEPTFWSEHLFSIGAAISSILLSFALADRINFLRKEKMDIQSQLLKTERAAHAVRKNFSSQLILAQDNERKRLASELHDGVGQNLSLLSNALKQLEKKPDDESFRNASKITRETVNEIRFISHQLHPHILDQLGLVAAIESIGEHIGEQTAVRCDVNTDINTGNLDPSTQLHLYRIVQESLNNAIKHSQASHVEVKLEQESQRIILSITDNGNGLTDIEKISKQKPGLGLESIKQRVSLNKGSIKFKANVPHGLIIFITFPIPESA